MLNDFREIMKEIYEIDNVELTSNFKTDFGLTSFDFAKVVFINDKEGIQKAGKRFGKRVIVAVLIFLVPTILIFISNLIGVESIDDCVKQLEQIVEEESS